MDGLRVHFLAWAGPPAGGEPLVLVHGLGVSCRSMARLAGILAAGRPVYAPDVPGFGRSARPRRTLDVPGQADFLASWMAAAGLERAAFLGHSLGSQAVADLAFRRPELVERLVLAAPTIDDAGRTVPGEVLRLLLDVPREPFSLIPVVLADYLRAGPVRIFRTLRHALADRVEEKLPAIGMPALVMRGERDPVVSGPWAEKVRRRLPRGRLAVIPKAGHALQFGFPRETAAVVAAFLAEEAGRA